MSAAECTGAFGPGFICADSGLCEAAEIEPTCQNQLPNDLLLSPEKYKDYLVLGSLFRDTGKEAARHDSAELAIESVNRFLALNEDEFPALKDLRFGVVQCAHTGDTEQIAELAHYLTETLQTPAILGPASSSGTSAAFTRVNLNAAGEESRQALFVSPSATSVALTSLEKTQPGLLWRTAPMDDGQGLLMGNYAVETGEEYVVFYEQTSYGQGLFDELMRAAPCDECGISFDASTGDVVPLALALASDEARSALQKASTIFFIGAQESHIREMMSRLPSPEFTGKILFVSDAAASSETIASVPAGFETQIFGSRASAPMDTEALRFFTAAYEGRHEESPLLHSFTANTYDATWLVLLALMQTRLLGEKVSAEALAEKLTRFSDKAWASQSAAECPLPLQDESCPPLTLDTSDLHAILTALAEEVPIDIVGASGPLNYCTQNEELERSVDAFELWHLEESTPGSGDFVIVGDAPLVTPFGLPPCPD